MRDRIESVLEHVNGPVVLDLGAVQHDARKAQNDDWLHGRLGERFERVIGVDMLESEVTKLEAAGYEIVVADVETMQLDIEADTVVAGELIEHVSNPGLMLARIWEHLKSEGRLVLTTPNPWTFVRVRQLVFGGYQINDEHTAWHGPQTLRQLLGRHGFHVEHLAFVDPVPGGMTGLCHQLGMDALGTTTILCVARKEEHED